MDTKETENYTVTWDDSDQARRSAYDALIEFFHKHESYSGESIYQCDAPQIGAPDVLCYIAEKVFKFKANWKE